MSIEQTSRRWRGVDASRADGARERHRRDVPRAQAFVAFVVNLAFFVLYVATANYTRLLLDELRKLGMDATQGRRRQSNTAATATAQPPVATVRGEPVTLAAVQPPPVAMDDSYTGPAPSAYEAQQANYR